MAGTPRYKVYDQFGTYVAATVDSTLAASLIGSALGEGATVKFGGRIIWREGSEVVPASINFEHAADIMDDRVLARQREVAQRQASEFAASFERQRVKAQGGYV